jgi:hypothetical protein
MGAKEHVIVAPLPGVVYSRSGEDMSDVFTLDLNTWEWSKVVLPPPLDVRAIGRSCGSALVGSKVVLFAGSLQMHNIVSWLDLEGGWGAGCTVR